MSIDINEPAFPASEQNGCNNGMPGMSLRDYFAAKAMQSIILDPWYANQERPYDVLGEHIAIDAYTMADAMLLAREK